MTGRGEAGNNSRFKRISIQVISCAIANLAIISPGMGLGFSAIAIPALRAENSTITITDSEASWIASIFPICTPLGSFLSGPVLDSYGRKAAILAINIPCFLGWFILALPQLGDSLAQLYIGRALTGFSLGMASIPATVYGAEISQSSLRGMFVTWTSICIAFGVLLVYSLGWIIKQWKAIAWICSALPLSAFVVTLLFLNESPSWLLSKGRVKEATASLKKLRAVTGDSVPPSVQEELDALTQDSQKKSNRANSSSLRSTLEYFLRPETFKPFIIMNSFFFFQQFSGVFVVIFYAVNIVKDTGSTINEYLATVLIGLMRFIVTIPISYISKRFGRRPPSIVSGAGMTICMAMIALYLYLEKTETVDEVTIKNLSWLPVTALLMYIVTSTVGFMTLPWAMVGELYPARVRGLAAGLTTGMAYVFSFMIIKLYPDMVKLLGKDGVFLFYSLVSLLGTLFVIFYLPETKGKTLKEIEEYFTGKSSRIAVRGRAEEFGSNREDNAQQLLSPNDTVDKSVIIKIQRS